MAKAENVKSSLCLGYVLQWFCLFRLSQGDNGRTSVRPGRQILDLLRTKIGFSSQKLGKNRTRTYSGYKLDICWTNSWCRTKVGQKLGYPHCQPAPEPNYILWWRMTYQRPLVSFILYFVRGLFCEELLEKASYALQPNLRSALWRDPFVLCQTLTRNKENIQT